ncbi:isobutyrate:CoA ligase IbuL [Saccharothrix violaceirubra]|uniref:Acetyl-CoA synthetase n=1 Tax=Saccharothrix violaceirubra TaxID=413306 RepID=A0A7W7T3P1_9PSEU|nr:AMP-binding protein [Saccharothrix violaceirubra]MBB4964755.1 acetyl-CoA synthetase [Saccharothrix violaceirubra]
MTAAFRAARDLLLAHGSDLDAARRRFRWPEPATFNWASDWFDVIAAGNTRTALRVVSGGEDVAVSFEDLSRRSARVANWLRALGVRRLDPVLVLLPNRVELWEVLLAAIKLGAVIVPTHTTATRVDVVDRVERAGVRHVVADVSLVDRVGAVPGNRIVVGGAVAGWTPYGLSRTAAGSFTPDGPTPASDPLFRYFTAGTTSWPKMVEHSHASHPVGHLSGMYWTGVRPGDVHLDVSSPGGAWSSFFVPWNAEATVVALTRVRPRPVLDVVRTRGVSTFCASPAVWRGLVARGLGARPPALREATSSGEPLDREVAERVLDAWGLEVRDGYGQTETTAQVGNPPGRPSAGLGRPLPGYDVEVLSPTGSPVRVGEVGELCVSLSPRPVGVMPAAGSAGHHRTGDLVRAAADGSLRFVARDDDMVKSSGRRVSPVELEQVLLRHPAVAEAAVVPSPHRLGDWEPKAFVVKAAGAGPDEEVAASVFTLVRTHLPEEKRVALLGFVPCLPRTSSGKVRRAALRTHCVPLHRP